MVYLYHYYTTVCSEWAGIERVAQKIDVTCLRSQEYIDANRRDCSNSTNLARTTRRPARDLGQEDG
jgi:hypothetical protein